MPVTGTLGALTYTRTSFGADSWVMQFASTDFANIPVNFKSFDTLDGEVFISGGLNLASAGGGLVDVYSNSFVLSVLTDSVPRVRYSTEYLRNQPIGNVSSVNGVTETVTFSSPIYPKFASNQFVRFNGGGGNISGTVGYYIANLSGANPSQCKLSLAAGGPTINLTSATNLAFSMASLVANSTSGEHYPDNIRFSPYDTTLKLGGHMEMISPPSTDEFSTEYAGVITLDTSGTFNNSVRFLPRQQPNNNTVASTQSCVVLPISSGNVVTSQVYYLNVGGATPDGNAFNVITRIDNSNTVSWQRTSNNINSGGSTNYPYVYTALLDQVSDGNVINVVNTKYFALPFPNTSTRQTFFATVNKLNQSNGSTIWETDVTANAGPSTQYPGPCVGLAVDSNDKVYIATKELELDISPFNTYGSFIVSLNSSGSTAWQKHYVINSSNTTQIESLDIDSSDGIYFVAKGSLAGTGPIENRPATIMIIGQLDTAGNTVWCNKMTFTNSMSVFPLEIKKYDDSLFILAENGDNNIGMLFKIPADGTRPGDGTYAITNPFLTYNIIYTSDSLNIVNSNLTISLTTANLANLNSVQFSGAIYSDDPVTLLKDVSPLI
jgi:hypothetical protein